MPIIQYLAQQVWPRFLEFAKAPATYPEMLWTIVPLLCAMIFINIYFGRHRTEELGWNTAFGNTISLIFVSASMFRFLYMHYGLTDFMHPGTALYKLGIACAIVLLGLILSITNYFHSIPKILSFLISSGTVVNGIAILSIIVVQAEIPIDKLTIITGLITIGALLILFGIVRHFIKPSVEAKRELTRRKHEREEKFHDFEEGIVKKIKNFFKKPEHRHRKEQKKEEKESENED